MAKGIYFIQKLGRLPGQFIFSKELFGEKK